MSDIITVKGTVHELLDTQSFASGFSKRILVIQTADKYPQTIPVEFVKDKCDALNSLSIGQQVTAYVNLRGNEYNGKYYASIQGWKFEAGQEPERTQAHSQSDESRRKMHGSEPKNLAIPSNRQSAVEDDGDFIPY